MTLKYEGDKVSRVGGGNGGDTLGYLFKMFFGTDPSQWVRFVMLGALLTWAVVMVRDFRNDVVRYMAANEQWKATSAEERTKLIRKADARLQRLYEHNGWVYQGLTE